MLQGDHLIQVAGAMGMAAADELLAGTEDELLIVDRHHRRGGHWDDAYPFVHPHQPRASDGLNARPLGRATRTRSASTAACTSWPRAPRCWPASRP